MYYFRSKLHRKLRLFPEKQEFYYEDHITDVIILAGGLGTRLSATIGNTPKGLAEVAGVPFLHYIITYLRNSGFRNIILSVGHLHQQIIDYFGTFYYGSTILYAIEKEPLGTGGALLNGLRFCTSENVLVMNGDTLFNIDLYPMYLRQFQTNADAIFALRRVKDAGRYGTVIKNRKGRILEFREKDPAVNSGLVNGGVYLMKRRIIEKANMPPKFSLERDFFAENCKARKFLGIDYDDYFIDIGIPEDYAQAQIDIPNIKGIHGTTH